MFNANSNKANKSKTTKPEQETDATKTTEVSPVSKDTVTFITIRPNMRVGDYRFKGYFLTLPKDTAERIKKSITYRSFFWVDEELEELLVSDDYKFPEKVAKELRKYFMLRNKAEKKRKK